MATRSLPAGITIRAIRATDLLALERFYEALSIDSIDARFHGAMHGIPEPAARSFCRPDHVHREGLVAVLRQGRDDVVVGHLCLEPAGDRTVEMAVAVADAWQHHGIGRALLDGGLEWARTRGFDRVRAAIRWSNPAIVGLLRSVGRPVRMTAMPDGDLEAVIDLTTELPAVA
jgi:GNAT superfamily N-acetyltransferase